LIRLATLLFPLFLVFPTQTVWSQTSEQEIYVWDLSDLYSNVDAWESAFADLENRLETVVQYRGTLGESAESMSRALNEISDANKELTRLYIYTSLRQDADQRVAEEQTRFGRAMQLYSNWSEGTSWMNPEILAVGPETVNRYLAEEPGLADFGYMLQDILRMAPYTLDENTEAILAQASMLMSSPEQIYNMYANADIPWPSVTLSNGEEAQLTQAGYTFYRALENRDDRKLVFDRFWNTWQQYGDGMGATLGAEVQANVFSARARNYDSVLQQNLFADGLPSEIYTQLVSQVNDALPIFHRYLDLRGRMLGIDDMQYYDIYPPLVELETGDFTIERSKEIAMEALRPFGDEYLGLLEEGFAQNWMHSHPQPGKTSGAYMSGSAYDVHPYVLLNHNNDYASLSTFAHEWGHAVHTMLAKQNNPWETADYSTFIAEMASTINEILLEEYMIANAQTDEERLFYLGNALESIRGTFYRQTMFAEFELAIHEQVESGQPLNGSSLSQIYGDLLKTYHGHDEGVLNIDETYAIEWAYIPHFYYDFYVFQYSTSITGAAWFAEKFLAGDLQVRDNFLNVLKAGGSDYPHNILLNEAGLDMTQPEAYDPIIRRMISLMDRIEELL
jgi:oligoendopeptidase F